MPAPLELLRTTLVVTSRCTLRCELCQAFVPYLKRPEDLALADALLVLENYFQAVAKVKTFNISGGEPLLNKEFTQITAAVLSYAEQIEEAVTIVTNGTLEFNENLLKLMERFRHKIRVVISDYGELSPKVGSIVQSLNSHGIDHRVSRFHGENLYFDGWVDFRDHTRKHFTLEERDRQARACLYGRGRYFVIVDGVLYHCNRAQWRVSQGMIPRLDSECINLLDIARPPAETQRHILDLFQADSVTACAYCLGLKNDSERHYPARQLRTKP